MPSEKQESFDLGDRQPALSVLFALGFEHLSGNEYHKVGGQAAHVTRTGEVEFCFTNPDKGFAIKAGPFKADFAAINHDVLTTAIRYLR